MMAPALSPFRISRTLFALPLLVMALLSVHSALPPRLAAAEEVFSYGEVEPFALIDQVGNLLQKKDLEGTVWLAAFVFTRCEGPCPMLTANMAKIQDKIPEGSRFVSFSMDPEYDTPPVLDYYAKEHGAMVDRWSFVTGPRIAIARLLSSSFHLAYEEGDPENPGPTLTHSAKFVLVDAEGRVRRYFDGDDEASVRQIPSAMKMLTLERDRPWVLKLPKLNAALNALSAFLLLAGYRFIRAKKIHAHRLCMGAAFLVSTLFLVSYLVYHRFAGSVPFAGQGVIRTVYFAILISHSALAAIVPPLALTALYRAWKGDFDRHAAVARWTLPLWLYVSVTGVVIYAMLYL